ncbi:MAG: polyphosphate polymerase domain-containing protein [Lachnospiraceae bacterium]|nr:polyphosphate polymerase domain-containing protein [Lachnospiraceae bacterium]
MKTTVQTERKFRHETKHEVRYVEYLSIRSRLLAVTGRDIHVEADGTYKIRSLYFDNYRDKALREKVDGINEREKFRIRYYNGNTDVIHLEKKSKLNGLCRKLSAKITKEQVEELLRGNRELLYESGEPLLIELYTKMKSEQLRPQVIVDYTREPYVYAPGNVRITFDSNIRTGLYTDRFFDRECPTLKTDKTDTVLMEVKYDDYMPEIIRMCIQENERQQEAFSKYAACRRFV